MWYEKNTKKFSHLSKSERNEIAILRERKYSLREIAAALKRSLSTLSDELRRNKVRRRYDPEKAHHKAYVRRWQSKYQGMKIVGDEKLRVFVESNLFDDQSPVNLSKRIKKQEKHLPAISKNSIYRFIKSPYGRKIEAYRNKKRPRWRRARTRVGSILNRVFIDKRPQIANRRKRIGDTEADFIVSGKSGQGIILNVTDRKSRAPFLERIVTITIKNVHRAFVEIKKRFPELTTVTTDNDILFQKHRVLENLLKVKIYFCRPYHSWEKGTVERTNRCVRKDIPKGSNISKYSKRFIMRIEEKLQRRIYQCLDYHTPLEVLQKHRKRKKPHGLV